MVAELVETSRLFGRTAARIRPQWVEPLAGHLVRRTYGEPRWARRRGSVVATERVTLYGLPVVEGRTVAYGRIDPVLSRELFIRRALVEGDWDTRHAFLHANRALVTRLEELEHRARRRDIVVEDQVVFDLYDARIPADVVSAAHFDRWWRDARREDPELLTFTPEMLVDEAAASGLDPHATPTAWRQGELTMPLRYHFEPGNERDGVTVAVPLEALGQIQPAGFDWLVPSLRNELVTELIRSLPKALRRELVPAPEVAAQVVARLRPHREPLLAALGRELEALRGVRIPPDAWDVDRLPAHLRMRFRVEDASGEVVAEADDLDALREELRPRLRARLAEAAAGYERHGLRDWGAIGHLPRTIALPGTGQAVRAYPSLVDEGDTAGVRVLDTPEEQRAAMLAGTRRLLLLAVPSPVRSVLDRLDSAARLTLAGAPHGSAGALLEDATAAAIDALVVRAGGPAWGEEAFAALRDAVARRLPAATASVVAAVVRILDLAREVGGALDALTAAPLAAAREDVRAQLRRLVPAGFVVATGAGRLADLERYLLAALRRVQRLPDAVVPDTDHMATVHELEQAHAAVRASWPRGRPLPEALAEVPWLLDELRVSLFAQGVGVRGVVSAKRIRRILAQAKCC
jgi:ATP-dependent helicase HrpA